MSLFNMHLPLSHSCTHLSALTRMCRFIFTLLCCRQQARANAISSPTAEFLLERPQPAPMLLPDAESLAAGSTTAEGSPQRDVSTNDTGALAPEAGELMPSVTCTWPSSIVTGCSFRSTRACWRCSRYSAHCSAVDWNSTQRQSV